MSISLPFFPCALLWPLILLLTHATLSIGTITSATIDDSSGDSLNPGVMPVYSPPSAFSLNSDCSGCLIKADPAQAFDGTWHDSSQLPGEASVSITLSFTGTGIDVFCILANTVQGAATTTDLAFTLDGSPQQPFSHTPDSTFSYLYNQNVLSVSGLAQASHQLVITTDSSGSLLLFDYARYTCVLFILWFIFLKTV
ncbi:hypothetical protein C8R44DRAFT_626506 [Mycena epipterygia]|nr:hypothetical protein C8R44DRAFT_626506 [Mycena epipterygia]